MKVAWFRPSVSLKSGNVTLGQARRAARDAKAGRSDSSSPSVNEGSPFWDQHLGHFGGTSRKRKVAKKAYLKKTKGAAKKKSVKRKSVSRRPLAKKK